MKDILLIALFTTLVDKAAAKAAKEGLDRESAQATFAAVLAKRFPLEKAKASA